MVADPLSQQRIAVRLSLYLVTSQHEAVQDTEKSLTCRDGVQGALRGERSLGVGVEAAADAQTDRNADGSNKDERCCHQSILQPAVPCRHK